MKQLLNVALGLVFLYAANQTLLMFGLWGLLIVMPATIMLLCLTMTTNEEGKEDGNE